MIKKKSILRKCISCKEIFDRDQLLKITKDNQEGILINSGFGRSAYICKTEKCKNDSKFKKNLQKALKTTFDKNFYEVFTKEMQKYK